MLPIPDIRPLSVEELSLLSWLLQHGAEKAAAYLPQLQEVTVVSRCGCGCPTVDFAVCGRVARPGCPSTILAEAVGDSPEGVRVSLILHARDSLLSELEVYDLTGLDHPFTLPRIVDLEPIAVE